MSKARSGGRPVLRGLLVLTALAVGGLLIAWFVANRSGPAHDETVDAARTVRTIEARLLPFRVRAHGFSVARPAEVWQAVANVQGRVVYRHDGLASGTTVRAAVLEVGKTRRDDALEVMEAVERLLDAERRRLGDSVRLVVTQDMTSIVRDRLQMLVENGLMGLVLVVLVARPF